MYQSSVRVEQSAYSDATGTQRGRTQFDETARLPTAPALYNKNTIAGALSTRQTGLAIMRPAFLAKGP